MCTIQQFKESEKIRNHSDAIFVKGSLLSTQMQSFRKSGTEMMERTLIKAFIKVRSISFKRFLL